MIVRCSVAVVLLLAGCAGSTRVTDLGAGQFTMTKRSSAVLVRSEELRRQVEQEALEYCRPRGGALDVVESRGVDPEPPDYPSATIAFRCVPA